MNNCSYLLNVKWASISYTNVCTISDQRSLNISARGAAELKRLKDELRKVKAQLKSLRTTLSNHKVSLKTAARVNEKLKLENNELEAYFAHTIALSKKEKE